MEKSKRISRNKKQFLIRQNHTKHSIHPKYWLSGEKAKKFRRDLVKNTLAAQEHTLTFKFPLVITPPDATARDGLRKEYEKIASIKENSLFHFFVAVHMAGFRLYSSVGTAETETAHNKPLLSDFNREFNKLFNLQEQQEQTGKNLLVSLGQALRSSNKNEQKLIKRTLKSIGLTSKSVENHPELKEFINKVCAEIADKEHWYQADKDKRWQVVEKKGKAMKGSFPDLPHMQSYKYSILWNSASKSFLKEAKHSTSDLSYAMNQLVSYALHITKQEKTDVISALLSDKSKSNGGQKRKAEAVISVLLSDNNNSNVLNWLFNPNPNKGISILKKSAKEIQALDVDIGDCSQESLKVIQDIADKLSADGIQYQKYRTLFSLTIKSFVSNYLKRLDELKHSIDELERSINDTEGVPTKIADNLQQLKNEKFANVGDEFAKQAMTISEFDDFITDMFNKKQQASDALDKLLGNANTIADKNDVITVENFSSQYDECRSLAKVLAEIVRKKNVDKKGDFSASESILPQFLNEKKTDDDDKEDEGKALTYKINRFRGAAIFSESDINTALKQNHEKLERLQRLREEHWQRIAKDKKVNIIEQTRNKEEQRIINSTKLKNKEDYSKKEHTALACRNILSRIASGVRRCGDGDIRAQGIKLFDDIISDSKVRHNFFENGKGRIYKSPFADYSHDALTLGNAFQQDIEEATKNFITRFFDWTAQLPWNAAMRDKAILESIRYALQAGGLVGNVAKEVAQPKDELIQPDSSGECILNLPFTLRLALKKKATLTPGEVANILNLYNSEINGLCASLSRRRVIAKLRLQKIGDNKLYWSPKKDKDWHPPKQAIKGDKPLAQGWRLLQQQDDFFTDIEKTAVAAAQLNAAARWLEKNCKDKTILRHCLRQMPHDWYYKTGDSYPMLTPPAAASLSQGVFVLSKNTIESQETPAENYIRLAGASRYKGWLDNMLIDDSISIGDVSLIVEEEYEQRADAGGLRAHHASTRAQLAIPFNHKQKKEINNELPSEFADHFMAIDLGERGIGYAVFQIDHKQDGPHNITLQQHGHVVVPLLRKLMRRVDFHRRKTQPRQRFQSNLNTALQQMREAAIGELAGIIDALINRYKAFPIFESSVANFEVGSNQLKIVYRSILDLYTYSGIEAHQNKRAKHWLCKKSPKWEHPYLLKNLDDKKLSSPKKLDDKKLSLFPGTTVYPMGTSQTCSVCGSNPLPIIKALNEKTSLKTDENGVLRLGENDAARQIYIYDGNKKNVENKYNPLPAREQVKKEYQFKDTKELEKHVKNMLRHKPLSAKSKDTSQSSYLSPFVCVQQKLFSLTKAKLAEKHMFRFNGLVFMHADVNAAINIGKKWWCEKIEKDKNCEK